MAKIENCTTCNIILDKGKYKKDKTICKNCYKKKKRKNNNNNFIQNQQTKKENINDNYIIRTLSVGPSFSGKICLMLKILSRIPNQDIYTITKSPPEQYSKSKIKIKPLNEYENAIIASDDFLGTSIIQYTSQFFIRGRQINLDINYLSQLYFDLPKKTIRNNSNKMFLFNQTLKDIENI